MWNETQRTRRSNQVRGPLARSERRKADDWGFEAMSKSQQSFVEEDFKNYHVKVLISGDELLYHRMIQREVCHHDAQVVTTCNYFVHWCVLNLQKTLHVR